MSTFPAALLPLCWFRRVVHAALHFTDPSKVFDNESVVAIEQVILAISFCE